MLKIGVLVSGGGTNLQAIIDRIEDGTVTNARIETVVSNNKNAYALERARAHGILAKCISPKDYPSRAAFNEALYDYLTGCGLDLIVLAGYLVVVPEPVIARFRNRMINIHPSLIPSFCGTGYYGLKVHEAALARGVKVSGATVHFVDEGTYRPYYYAEGCGGLPGDTPKTLQQRIMEEAEWGILPEVIDAIANGRVEQKGNIVTVLPRASSFHQI